MSVLGKEGFHTTPDKGYGVGAGARQLLAGASEWMREPPHVLMHYMTLVGLPREYIRLPNRCGMQPSPKGDHVPWHIDAFLENKASPFLAYSKCFLS